MLARVYAMAFLSVCLRVTRVLCIKMAKRFVEILLTPDSPIILVFHHWRSLINANGFTPTRAPNTRGGEKCGNFLPISWCISETVRDTTIVAIEVEQETIPKPSNGGTFHDLEWPQPPVSRLRYSLKANVSQTVHAMARQHDVARVSHW